MLDVHATSYPPRRRWTRHTGAGAATGAAIGVAIKAGAVRRSLGFVSPALTATVLAALILHLMTELGGRLASTDAGGVVSAVIGMAAVLVILLPFTILCARRAQEALSRGMRD